LEKAVGGPKKKEKNPEKSVKKPKTAGRKRHRWGESTPGL